MSNDNDKVLFPFQLDREFKDMLLDHCREYGMTLSGLIRMLLTEYANENGVTKEG